MTVKQERMHRVTQMKYIAKEPINKGWSSDKKYCVTDEKGTRYLLRVSDIAQYDTKQSEFNMMKQVYSLGVPMCQPIEFGVCEEGVYSIQSWIDGVDAEEVISDQSDTEQYVYGLEAGRILRRIHSIPAPETQEDWESRFNRKMDCKIRRYGECPVKYENGQAFIDYINENRHLFKNRPQVYQHGDYHIGNMMIDRKGQLHIIDFNRNDYGDPWEEFNRIVWCAQSSPLFASGMVNGYFDGHVPQEFWRLLALYISSNTLSSDKLCQGCFRKNRIITKGRMVLKLLSRGNGDFGLVLLFQISVVHERPPLELEFDFNHKILTVFPGWIILIFKESLNWTIPK